MMPLICGKVKGEAESKFPVLEFGQTCLIIFLLSLLPFLGKQCVSAKANELLLCGLDWVELDATISNITLYYY